MNKIFDFKLYCEGMRRLKIMGIIWAAFMGVISVFTLIAEVSNAVSGKNISVIYTTLSSINPMLYMIFCIAAPIMALYIFKFTTTRAASDFYFAIPKTRGQIFVSLWAAVMSWVVIVLLAGSALPIIISLFLRKFVVINIYSSWLFFLQILIGTFLVVSAVLVAMGITGNTFSNILTALMIIFVPRIFLTVIVYSGMGGLSIVDPQSTIALLAPKTNIPFNFVMSFFSGSFNLGVTATSGLYSFILGVIYLVGGYFIFKHRKSEAAGNVAATKILRSIFRIMLAATVGLIAVELIINDGDIIADALFIVIAFIVYCSYELIATKSFKTLAKVLPGFLIAVAIDVAVIFAIIGVESVVTNYKPTAKQIDGVYVTSDRYNSDSGDDCRYDYWQYKNEDVLIKDSKINSIVSKKLKENIENSVGDAKDDNYYNKNDDVWYFTIVSGGIKHNRIISVDAETSMKIIERLKDYAVLELPDVSSNSTEISIDNSIELSRKQLEKMYSCYKQDIKSGNVSFNELYYNTVYDIGEEAIFRFNISFIEGKENFSISLPVTPKHKKTLEYFYAVYKDKNIAEAKAVTAAISSLRTEYVTVKAFNLDGSVGGYSVDNEKIYECINSMGTLSTDNLNGNSKLLEIYLEKYQPNGETSCHTAFFALTESQAKWLSAQSYVYKINESNVKN